MGEKISGIYCIENKINGKKYIGKSINLHKRNLAHFADLRNNRHGCKHLQSAYNIDGFENFNFIILEKCSENILSEREIFYIAFYKSKNSNFGYNSTDGGEGNNNPNEESLLRMSICKLGDKNPMFGRKLSEEHKSKILQSLKGEKHHYYHKNRSNEDRDKISKNLVGKKLIYNNGSSKYVGVRWKSNAWEANLKRLGKAYYLGRYKLEEDAARAYDKKAFEIYGKDAKLNFPEDHQNA